MRISGALASLVGLESAIESNQAEAIDAAIRSILLLHSVILSFGGLPLLYYGDAIGMVNSLQYLMTPPNATIRVGLIAPALTGTRPNVAFFMVRSSSVSSSRSKS